MMTNTQNNKQFVHLHPNEVENCIYPQQKEAVEWLFKLGEEMEMLFLGHPEALENTIEVCNKIEGYEI